jgi:hypothetical protein
MSNSKLEKFQKVNRKVMLAGMRDAGGTIATVGRFTVAIMPEFPGSSMARMSVSFASENETKLRRKVGEYHALARLYKMQSVPVPVNFDALNMADFMEESYEF